MRSLAPHLFVAISAALALAAGGASAREPLHVWTDAAGVVHIEDPLPGRPRPPRNSKSVRPSGKTARAAKVVHWWERATDAPPDEIDRAAASYNIPAELIRAVIAVESAGDTAAVSRTGAKGLMQLMPQTADHVFVDDPVDPAQNIQGGTRYLRELANEFNGDMMLMLAAYNAGPEAVRKYHGVPPFEETRGYVRKVIAHYNELKHENELHAQMASAAPEPKAVVQSASTGPQGKAP